MDILHGSYIDTQAVLEAKRKELKKMGSLFKDFLKFLKNRTQKPDFEHTKQRTQKAQNP